MTKNLKNIFNKNKKSFITFILTNRLFMSFVLILTLETSLLSILTGGIESFGFEPLFFNFAIIVLIGALGYLFKPKKQYRYFQIMLSIITAICIINGIYYAFYNSYVTIGLLSNLGQVNTVTDAVFDKLSPLHVIYIIFPVLFYLINRILKKHNYFNYVSKIENGKKNFATVMLVGVIFLCINIITLTSTDISRLIKQWNREYIVDRYGILAYQINDIVQSTRSQLFSYFGYDEAAQRFIEYFSTNKLEVSSNKYTGIFKDKDVILVHMESMMSMFVDLKINGQEVTPNLNKLVREGLYFSNFYPEIGVGTSSDTEFTLSSSLMPALSGTVFVNYYDRDYVTLQKMLKQNGYYTFSMHGNSSGMWNRASMHPSLGYETFYSKDYFDVTKENSIGLGISDHDFFMQAIEHLKTIESEHDKYMGTLITLTNHTPWDGGEAYGEFPLSATVERLNEETGLMETVEDKYLEDTRLGNYIRSVHYADKCLGEFIDSLYTNDLLNDAVLVFYGDHDAKLATKEYNYLFNYSLKLGRLLTEEDEGYINYDYYANELNRKTPLVIWTKDKRHVKEVDYYMGMIDVQPTLGNMLGLYNPYALGNDIFEIKHNNTIVFPNGNFLTESVYYNNSKGEYKVLKDSVIIDETYIQKNKEYAEKILELSNDIIVYDLIKTEGEKINSETTQK